ncbi:MULTISPECIES: hypothetical protein [Asticcacaulis]|uniref:hypothetical protein n=1 Tax=Asticcacaulis TaxID=76890 RepID=UPI001AE2B236|nr:MULTISPECIES: hypothetical protein [Asticcacaulis]MBP2159713.1 hypothetical protein [Asticcacaulis solisilvae]MDR6800460.1 hypothetical protein [Asticcacaulis sp. BE141]
MSKLVTVYRRKGALFIAASHKTEAGFWVADEETSVVGSSDEGDVQRAVVEALARSQNRIPTPARDADLVGSLLSAAGVSSWSTFSKLAKCVDVHLKDGRLEITPYRNMGGSDGFEPMTDKAVELSEGSPDLGKTVLAALELAE